MNLPEPIRTYFEANARLDGAAMAAAFAHNAVVRDEGNTHEGTEAIRTWIDRSSIGTPAIATPQAISSERDTHRVTALVKGEFPGSPVTLSFRFRLTDKLISELAIG